MVYYKVKLFRKKFNINSKSSLDFLKSVLHKLGCNVSTYSEGRLKLIALKRSDEMKSAPSLTVIDESGETTVYYNEALPDCITRYALAHEIGHLSLNHRNRNLSTDAQEAEADKFAELVLAPKNLNLSAKIILVLSLALVICLSVINKTVGYDNEPKLALVDSAAENDENTCYYTEHGEVYHIYSDCYYLDNANAIYSGTVSDSHKDRLCSACDRRKNKE